MEYIVMFVVEGGVGGGGERVRYYDLSPAINITATSLQG